MKSLGFNTISFYVDWALLEGNPGHYTADGVFAFEPFFDAAREAGIYLIARPGPVSLYFSVFQLQSRANICQYSTSTLKFLEVDSQDGFNV